MTELQCYNRGCGKKYIAEENTPESCQHHPGVPFFHDAYKGWSCCNKKCIDFTEFLNIKGCTFSMHSNVQQPEPEKPKTDNIPDSDVIVVQPITKTIVERPPYNTVMTKLKPEIAASLQQSLASASVAAEAQVKLGVDEIPVGTRCKNGGCSAEYLGPDSDTSPCVHHPGSPVFHEGMKYWSCCQKRTSDFNVFLNQVGCSTGKHVWRKSDEDAKSVECRWDFHQTATHVIVSVYAKQYNPNKSEVQLNPIRLHAKLVFSQENDAVFTLDHELHGIVDVEKSNVTMYGTKVEIKLKKASAGHWTRLEVLRKTQTSENSCKSEKVEALQSKIDSVDLSDL